MDDDPLPSMMILAEIAQVSAGFWLINGLFLIILLFFSALVSGSEVAFFSLTQADLRDLQSGRDEKSQLVIKLVESPEQLLSTILILNYTANIAIITLSTIMAWTVFGSVSPGIFVLVPAALVVFVLVFFGEVIPRAYANNKRKAFARLMAQSLYVFSIVLRPISSVLLGISNVIEKKIERKGYSLSTNELHQALEMTAENTTEEEKDI